VKKRLQKSARLREFLIGNRKGGAPKFERCSSVIGEIVKQCSANFLEYRLFLGENQLSKHFTAFIIERQRDISFCLAVRIRKSIAIRFCPPKEENLSPCG
jgi:hypothetical protein